MAAGENGAESSEDALETLCEAYWYPIYVYVRRKGHGPDEAKDLTQEFFSQLLAKHQVRLADRHKGRFRSFLLAALKNFLANEWDKAHAAKRGGEKGVISLDGLDAEGRYAAEAVESATPERLYERRWALALLDQVLKRLGEQYRASGQQALFDALEATLAGGRKAGHADIAGKLGMTEAAVKVAAHRLRRRYRDLLREEIGQTLADPDDADEEIRYLLSCL
jgi:RNA polymerase sigma-70 factor (ECF subfamily)